MSNDKSFAWHWLWLQLIRLLCIQTKAKKKGTHLQSAFYKKLTDYFELQ